MNQDNINSPAQEPSSQTASVNDKQKILLVEDDPFLVKMYVEKFKNEGFDVITSDNGIDGLKLALDEKIEAIILDLMIPKLSGIEFMKRLNADEKGKTIPVIVLTNISDKEEQFQAKNLGAKDYLLKANLTPKQVVEKIKYFLSTS